MLNQAIAKGQRIEAILDLPAIGRADRFPLEDAQRGIKDADIEAEGCARQWFPSRLV
jgi:hypothetical protein